MMDLKALIPSGSIDVPRDLSNMLPRFGVDVVSNGTNSINRLLGNGLAYLLGAVNDLDRVKVDITLRDNVTGKYVDIPVIPEKITYKQGDQIADEFKIVGLGNVSFPSGVGLDSLSWQSFFPGRYDGTYCRTSAFIKPNDYKDWFNGWKDKGTLLQVIIPAWDINKTMTVKSFSWDGQGFEGDIYYSLDLQEYKKVEPKEVDVGGTVSDPNKKTPEDRHSVSQEERLDGSKSP